MGRGTGWKSLGAYGWDPRKQTRVQEVLRIQWFHFQRSLRTLVPADLGERLWAGQTIDLDHVVDFGTVEGLRFVRKL